MKINGVNYHINVTGAGAPLVLLHGFTGSSANWREHIPMLAERFQVISIDLLGHGQTDAPTVLDRYRMAHAAADLAAIFDAVAGEPVQLLGYSMGGRLALYTAVHHPAAVRTLILESSSPGLRTEAERATRRESDHALAERIEREGIEAFVNFWESLALWESQQQLSAQQRAALRAQRLTNTPHGLANSLRGMGTGEQSSLWDDLAALDMPVLLLAGELDVKFAAIADEMHAHLPDAQRVIIPDAGHTIHLEQPDAWRQSILKWLP